MTLKNAHFEQTNRIAKLDFTLWRLQREYEQRHRLEVNRALSERARERPDGVH